MEGFHREVKAADLGSFSPPTAFHRARLHLLGYLFLSHFLLCLVLRDRGHENNCIPVLRELKKAVRVKFLRFWFDNKKKQKKKIRLVRKKENTKNPQSQW
ncbi:unnamed protein product [Prunus armeniaca]|uniref:Uncharacterized protein n=1 Tax=Prunus armeniaca TaxID=36596 RepID=A0A6J5VCS0_PRUAR|nr:unnamed protein product [Prunus armeniaca]